MEILKKFIIENTNNNSIIAEVLHVYEEKNNVKNYFFVLNDINSKKKFVSESLEDIIYYLKKKGNDIRIKLYEDK